MSFTKQVFVVNDTSLTTAAANIDNESLSVYLDNALLATTLTANNTTKSVQFSNKLNHTIDFKVGDVTSYKFLEASAGTSQVIKVQITREADDSAYIKLIDVTDGREKFEMATFEVTAASNNDAAAALVLAINDSKRDAYADISAAVDNVTANQVNITIPVNRIFRVAANDASNEVTGTAPVFSIGTPADVRAEVESALPYMGITNIVGPNVKRFADQVSSANTYDRIVIGLEKRVGERFDTHEIVLYVKSTQTSLETQVKYAVGQA